MEGSRWLVDIEVIEQFPGDASVFAEEQLALAQGVQRPQCDVPQIADGCADEE